jgi:hypothetical protein
VKSKPQRRTKARSRVRHWDRVQHGFYDLYGQKHESTDEIRASVGATHDDDGNATQRSSFVPVVGDGAINQPPGGNGTAPPTFGDDSDDLRAQREWHDEVDWIILANMGILRGLSTSKEAASCTYELVVCRHGIPISWGAVQARLGRKKCGYRDGLAWRAARAIHLMVNNGLSDMLAECKTFALHEYPERARLYRSVRIRYGEDPDRL